MIKSNLTKQIKQKAIEIGFNDVGITLPSILEKETLALQNIILNKKHGSLKYLEKNVLQRKDISLFFNQAKSIIIVISSYFPTTIQEKSNYKISYYTYSNDYHYIIKSKLIELWNYIKEIIPNAEGKIFCDTSSVFEKAYAAKAGLGWIGKNTLFINSNLGSYVFIGGIVTNINLEQDNSICKFCPDSCNLCLKACPVNAIEKPYILNPSLCISYATIENHEPEFHFNNPTRFIAGCDICQQVCPYNQNIITTNKWFLPNEYVFWSNEQWENISSSKFKKVFQHTIFKRIGFKKLKSNIEHVKVNLH